MNDVHHTSFIDKVQYSRAVHGAGSLVQCTLPVPVPVPVPYRTVTTLASHDTHTHCYTVTLYEYNVLYPVP